MKNKQANSSPTYIKKLLQRKEVIIYFYTDSVQVCEAEKICMGRFSITSRNWAYHDQILLDSDFITICFNSTTMIFIVAKSKSDKGP